MFDAHHHLDLIEGRDAAAGAWARARARGVTGGIIAGVYPAGWGAQMALARGWPGLGWTAGLHPWWVRDVSDGEVDAGLEALTGVLGEEDGPAGLGEMGLDRSDQDDDDSWLRQERAFRAQLALARASDRPVVLHVVRAHGRALDLLAADRVPEAGGMVHAFTGPIEVARRYLALGLHISVGPMVANPRAARLRAAVPLLPADRLLVETDSPNPLPGPWMTAAAERSEPARLPRVVATVAALRGEDPAEVARYTEANGCGLFGLPASR